MKRKIAVLSLGLFAFMALTFAPREAKAECVTIWGTVCQPSQGDCCYVGGESCWKRFCDDQQLNP